MPTTKSSLRRTLLFSLAIATLRSASLHADDATDAQRVFDDGSRQPLAWSLLEKTSSRTRRPEWMDELDQRPSTPAADVRLQADTWLPVGWPLPPESWPGLPAYLGAQRPPVPAASFTEPRALVLTTLTPQPQAAGQNLTVDTANGNSAYAVTSSDTWATVIVGNTNTGVINHSAGTFTATGVLELGYYGYGGQGTYNLSGSGILKANAIDIAEGLYTTGTFKQTGGTVSITNNFNPLCVGRAGTGTYNLSAGSLSAWQIFVGGDFNGNSGNSGTGVFKQTGGTVTTNGGPLYLAYIGSSSSGTYTLGGGTLTTGGIVGSTSIPNSTFFFAGGTLRAAASDGAFGQGYNFISGVNLLAVQGNGGARIDTQGYSDTIALVLQHDPTSGAPAVDGGLTKLGTGTLTLSAANTFTGPTTASAGILDLNNALALQYSTLTPGAGTIAFDSQVAGGAFTVGGLGGSGNLALQNNAATPAAITLYAGNGNANSTLGGVLSGGGALHKVGTGTQTLTGTNTYTGGTFVDAGTLAAAHAATGTNGAGTFAAGSTVTVNSGGTLLLKGNNSLGTGTGYANLNILGGVVTTDGTSYITLNGVTMTGGTLTANGPGDGTYGTFYLNGLISTQASATTATLNASNGGYVSLIGGDGAGNAVTFNVAQGTTPSGVDLLVSAPLTGSVPLVKSGAGTLTLSGANTYTGVTTIQGGTLNVASLGNYGVASAIGSRAAAAEGGSNVGLLFEGGTLQYTGSTNQSTNRQIRLGNNTTNTIDSSGGGTLSFTYNGTNTDLFETPGTRTLNLTGTNTGGNVFAIGLTDQGSNPTSLVKAGAGTWTLTGNNTYSGTTTINGGTLVAASANGSATGTGAVTINGGGTLLGGTGSVSGDVTVNSGAGVLGGNGTASTGTLALGGALTLNSGSFIELALGAGGAHSTLARTGSGTWSFASGQAFTLVDAGIQTGLYDNIITGLSADPGGESSWTITGTRFAGTFAYDGAGGIDLTLTAVPEPATWAGGALLLAGAGWTLRRRLRRG